MNIAFAVFGLSSLGALLIVAMYALLIEIGKIVEELHR